MGIFVLVVPLFGVLVFWYLRGIVGVVSLLAAGFVTYQFIRFIIPILRSRVETSDQKITCIRPGSEDIVFRWTEVSHAGLVSQKSHKPSIFLYNEKIDQYATIPQEFSHFEQLLATVKKHTLIQDIQLDKTDTIQEWLRRELHIEPENANDSEESDESELS
jgi:hypothetical protein